MLDDGQTLPAARCRFGRPQHHQRLTAGRVEGVEHLLFVRYQRPWRADSAAWRVPLRAPDSWTDNTSRPVRGEQFEPDDGNRPGEGCEVLRLAAGIGQPGIELGRGDGQLVQVFLVVEIQPHRHHVNGQVARLLRRADRPPSRSRWRPCHGDSSGHAGGSCRRPSADESRRNRHTIETTSPGESVWIWTRARRPPPATTSELASSASSFWAQIADVETIAFDQAFRCRTDAFPGALLSRPACS